MKLNVPTTIRIVNRKSNFSNLQSSLIITTLLFNLLLVALQVLDHEILSGQLEVVPVVIDPLSWVQVEVVQYFVNGVTLDPENVPVLTEKIKQGLMKQLEGRCLTTYPSTSL